MHNRERNYQLKLTTRTLQQCNERRRDLDLQLPMKPQEVAKPQTEITPPEGQPPYRGGREAVNSWIRSER